MYLAALATADVPLGISPKYDPGCCWHVTDGILSGNASVWEFPKGTHQTRVLKYFVVDKTKKSS